jgi:hypothetical protein
MPHSENDEFRTQTTHTHSPAAAVAIITFWLNDKNFSARPKTSKARSICDAVNAHTLLSLLPLLRRYHHRSEWKYGCMLSRTVHGRIEDDVSRLVAGWLARPACACRSSRLSHQQQPRRRSSSGREVGGGGAASAGAVSAAAARCGQQHYLSLHQHYQQLLTARADDLQHVNDDKVPL